MLLHKNQSSGNNVTPQFGNITKKRLWNKKCSGIALIWLCVLHLIPAPMHTTTWAQGREKDGETRQNEMGDGLMSLLKHVHTLHTHKHT